MKRAIAFLSLIAFASSALAAASVGKPAPDFTATDINGKTVHLSDYKGKVVVLESYNQDCPYCHNQYANKEDNGAMQRLQKEATGKGVVWLIVNSVSANHLSHRTREQAQAEWKEYKINATAWLDDSSGALGNLYEMKTTPHMFIIDKSGKLVYAGAIDDQPDPFHKPSEAHNYVREALDKILAGETYQEPVSAHTSYGCSVKYD